MLWCYFTILLSLLHLCPYVIYQIVVLVNLLRYLGLLSDLLPSLLSGLFLNCDYYLDCCLAHNYCLSCCKCFIKRATFTKMIANQQYTGSYNVSSSLSCPFCIAGLPLNSFFNRSYRNILAVYCFWNQFISWRFGN